MIAAPPSPSFSALVTLEYVELALARALEADEVVVADAGTALDPRLAPIFSVSGTVCSGDLRRSRAQLGPQAARPARRDRRCGGHTAFVSTDIFAGDLLKATDVETALGYKVSAATFRTT